MKAAKLLLVMLIPFLIIACASREQRKAEAPEFNKGRVMGEEYAKKDIPSIDCSKEKDHLAAEEKAMTYTDALKEQGKTEGFIKGFRSGYEQYYYYQGISNLCR
jgi:hypothetical protein